MLRRRIAITILLALPLVALGQSSSSVTVTGYITDSLCGAKGANHLHGEHARRSVASGKAQYALYDQKSKKLYLIERATAEQWLGQRVRVTGTLSASPIQRAGESYAPDAVATVTVNGQQRPVSATAADPNPAPSGAVANPDGTPAPRVQRHAKALDTSTPVAGSLSVTSIEAAPR